MTRPKQIDFGKDFGDVVIKANGITVEITANGRVVIPGVTFDPPQSPATDNTPSGSTLLEAGQLIEGKGVYLGLWEPKDNKNGRILGRIFDVYAAPQDLKNASGTNLLMTFNDAVQQVAGLKNYHGHDGGYFPNEKAILDAVRNNPAALENWFLPSKELLHGKTTGGDKIQLANLYNSRNIGDFKNTFITKSCSGLAHWYWSLTEHPDVPSGVYDVDFAVGGVGWGRKDYDELSSRVVRAELRP